MDLDNKRIVVVFLMHLGDVILSTPFVRALRNAAPNSHITYVMDEKLKDVISTCQSLQGEMTYELFIGNRYNVKEKAKSIIAINPVDEYAQLLMKEQPLSYYNNHVSDITSEANALFTIGDYDRVISLCDKYSSLTGSKTLDSLKSKAQKCKGYREEILAIESQGELYVDYEYAPIFEIINKLLEINPYDLNAIDYYMMGWK